MQIQWNFDNSYARLPQFFYSNQQPIPVHEPKLVVFNESLAKTMAIPFDLSVLAGNKIPKQSIPISQGYAGHQFGHFTMLGDGRAVLLGEMITNQHKRFDIQLKGSGTTPYSRGGDGRAALGPMLREYLISEAMFNLGIPTTRSLAVVDTGERVLRNKPLKGAVLTRIASSHIRIGTFEYASRFGTKNDLQALADYTIERHFDNTTNEKDKYLLLLKEVINRQAYLIAKWQLVGFVHGVMNTDNMTISGETIDYGPCAFMDLYDENTVFSSIDRIGRYSYKNQPKAAKWNLARFGESLLPLFDDREKAVGLLQGEVDNFEYLYQQYWMSGMRKKLGLFNEESMDIILISQLLDLMQKFRADYTNIFKALTLDKKESLDLYIAKDFRNWFDNYQARRSRQDKSKQDIEVLMKENNPSIIPRNHQVEKILKDAENGEISTFNKFLSALNNPYAYSQTQEVYSQISSSTTYSYQTFCGT